MLTCRELPSHPQRLHAACMRDGSATIEALSWLHTALLGDWDTQVPQMSRSEPA